MRTYATVIAVAALCLGWFGPSAAATGDADPTTPAPTAETAATQTDPQVGQLQYVHAAEGAPAHLVELASPSGEPLGGWVAPPGDMLDGVTIDIVPDRPLIPGTYRMAVLTRDGTAQLATFAVPIAAGETTVVTEHADQFGRPLFVLHTPSGEQVVRPRVEGTLTVEHDVADGPTVEAVVWLLETEDRATALGTLDGGESLDATLEAGPHTLLLYAGGDEVGRADIFVVRDETTVVALSDVLDATVSAPPATSTDAEPTTDDTAEPTDDSGTETPAPM